MLWLIDIHFVGVTLYIVICEWIISVFDFHTHYRIEIQETFKAVSIFTCAYKGYLLQVIFLYTIYIKYTMYVYTIIYTYITYTVLLI